MRVPARGLRALPSATHVLELELLARVPGIAHGFETRSGDLTDVTPQPVACVHQVHGGTVVRLPAESADWRPFLEIEPEARPEADSLITDQRSVTVAVSVADCLPILIADPVHGAVAAVHGGWRSLAGGIIESTIEAMATEFGTEPSDLVVGVGPGIGPCCFEVGPEVIEALAARGCGNAARAPDPAAELVGGASAAARAKPHADLMAVTRAALGNSGVAADQIDEAALCTLCHSDFLWSYRQDGDAAGRMLCGIGLV